MTLEHDKVYSPTDVQELLKIDSSTLRNAPTNGRFLLCGV